MVKRCIYHVPYPITNETNSASAIRPRKMLEAFENNFDEVFVISGYGKERKKKFKELKKRVEAGIHYEFMYSENSTTPNLLTEKSHIPYYPFLERNIFRFCNKHGIPIGLFYRDIYWKFPVYKQKLDILKKYIMLPLYKYDLCIYNKYISIMYLPSREMGEYVDFKGTKRVLPPGYDIKKEILQKEKEEEYKLLELFYVGGVDGYYNISKLLESISQCNFLHLTICCHEDHFKQWIQKTRINIPSNVSIIHKKGEELEEFYKKADLGMLFFTSSGYRKMVMPVKLFEYLGHFLPIIATKDCAAGTFVEKNDIGWTVKYDTKELRQLLVDLNNNRKELKNKSQRMIEAAKRNTWNTRVLSVYNDFAKNNKEKL